MAGDRTRDRKVGDATLERIDDLAGGWSVKDSADPAPEESSSAITRKKRKSMPPPPPPGRKKRATGSPPPPPGRKKRATGPPPPPAGRKKNEDRARPSEPPASAVDLAPVAGEIRATLAPLPGRETPRSNVIEAASDREDDEATVHQPPGSGEYPSNRGRKVSNTTGTLRVMPTLPRRGGLLGDIVY